MGLQFAGFGGEWLGGCLPAARNGAETSPGESHSCCGCSGCSIQEIEQLPEAFRRHARTQGIFMNPGSEFAIIVSRWSSTLWKKDLGIGVGERCSSDKTMGVGEDG